MQRLVTAIFGLLVVAMLTSSMVYVVDQRQWAIVFALGEIKEVVSEPGLHFKLPPPDAPAIPPLLAGRTAMRGQTTAYVCRHFECAAPVTAAEDLAKQLV